MNDMILDPLMKISKPQKITKSESFIIKSFDIKKEAQKRRDLWSKWSSFFKSQGLRPVIPELNDMACPWAIPFYCIDISHRNQWINWGLKNNIPIFCWPNLPEQEIVRQGSAFEKWKTIVCSHLNYLPSKRIL